MAKPSSLPRPNFSELYEKFFKDISFFSSEYFSPDTQFNPLHRLYFWCDFPSPAPFRIVSSPEFLAKMREVLDKHPMLFMFDPFLTHRILFKSPEIVPLTLLADHLGMNKNGLQKPIANHDKRLKVWRSLFPAMHLYARSLQIIVYVPLILVPLYMGLSYALSPDRIEEKSVLSVFLQSLAIAAGTLMPLLIVVLVAIRLFSFMSNRKYTENLCVREILYILMELKNKDILDNADIKLNLQYRLTRLAKLTRFLALRFRSQDAENQLQIEQHFRAMALHIHEWERKLIYPTNTTVREIRRDFAALAHIYIKKSYGEFAVQQPAVVAAEKPVRGFLKGVVRFAGLVLPLVLLALYLSQPTLFPTITLDSKAVTFMFIGWLFLSIDSLFSLGVVKDLLSIAQGVKDLGG